MRVAIDATPLTLSSGGLARYTSELALALSAQFPQDDYYLVSDQKFQLPSGAPSNLRPGTGPAQGLDRRWWLWGVQREMHRLNATVFHGTNFAVPYFPARPSVMALHDLSPWMDDSWHHAADRVRRRTPLLIGLGIATLIVTDSEAIRKQAIDRFGINPDRIAAVPLAAAAPFRPVACPPPERPFFLYVGTLEPRKNLPFLVNAWRPVRDRYGVDLALAGRQRDDFPGLSEEPGLRFLGEVADEDLPALYSQALAFVYPSLYEGFGLPVLEAMQCGACVITSTDPAIGEVIGDAGARLDPRNARGWTEAMLACASGSDWLRRSRENSLARAAQFSWQRTARLTREVYSRALRRFNA
jgi:glycosyltransferase involved in cell wall biosynthesis